MTEDKSVFIPELGEKLSGRRLDIWRGHTEDGKPLNMPAAKREAYRTLWIKRALSPKEPVRKDCGCRKNKT